MFSSMKFNIQKIILYQEPQGAKRPRYRVVNRNNLISQAMSDPGYIHVYSPDASYNHQYMKRIIGDELINIEQLICFKVLYYRTHDVRNYMIR